ncbi:MAG TPA: aminotransferase class V-fold PLP-dependent enzyme, partial [Arthrobacter sp.]|nr:aminotransferase class V-fold PLP-dependent enzyme [Arthrobacter sp.]
MIFLDAAATTPVRREVLEAMWPFLSGEFGNPSSHHSLGDAAATALAAARTATARALGCRPGEVVFTSGGPEA